MPHVIQYIGHSRDNLLRNRQTFPLTILEENTVNVHAFFENNYKFEQEKESGLHPPAVSLTTEVTEKELRGIYKSIGKKKAPGLRGIPNKLSSRLPRPVIVFHNHI